jgi:MFS family permease
MGDTLHIKSSEHLPIRDALRAGGKGLVGTLLLIGILDEFPRTAATVLAPDIQSAFGISDTALLGLIGLVGVALVLTTLPAAGLGDRVRRTRVVAGGTIAVAASCVMAAFVPNAFLLAVALTGTGIGVGCRLPNASSLLADGYPLRVRSRGRADRSGRSSVRCSPASSLPRSPDRTRGAGCS